jgi:hypothetical protein
LRRGGFRLLEHWLRRYGKRGRVIDIEDRFGASLWLRI